MKFEPCTRHNTGSDGPSSVCPICGHAMLAHPGLVNNSLAECAICTVLSAVVRLEQRTPFALDMKASPEEVKATMALIKPQQGGQLYDMRHAGVTMNKSMLQEADDLDFHAQSFTTPAEPHRCPSMSPGQSERCTLPDVERDHHGCHLGEHDYSWPVGDEDKERWTPMRLCPSTYDRRPCTLPDTESAHPGGLHQAISDPFRWLTGDSDTERWETR